VRRALTLLLAIVVAVVGVVLILLILQSRDSGSLDRPPVTQTQTTP
jgi:hypothetical protein